MPRTLGFHLVLSGFGLWLPGDDRGHWSEAWDEMIGYHEPHALHAGDPVRMRMAEERMKHPPVRLDPRMIAIAAETFGRCANESDWNIAAASVEPTHTHLLLTYTVRDINNTVKWIKGEVTKAIHRETDYDGPVWCKGKWCGFIYDAETWERVRRYIERHNIRRGLPAAPYAFIVAT